MDANKFSLMGNLKLDDMETEYSGEDYDQSGQDTATTSGGMAGAAGAGKTLAKGGSGMDAASSGLMSAGVATANPYLIAAGAGMGVISGAQKKRRQRSEERAQREMQRRERVMAAMSKLGTGVGSIG